MAETPQPTRPAESLQLTSVPAPRPPLETLAAGLHGRLVTPADGDWDAARRAWNVAVDQQPLGVAEVADADDVCTVVRFAAEHGPAVAAQPGGHAATAALDGTLLIRTAALGSVEIDPHERTARVGSGVKWGRLLEALAGSGLTGLTGSNPDVSVVGYLLGGALSWFSRAHGLAASCLRAVDLVDATGTLGGSPTSPTPT